MQKALGVMMLSVNPVIFHPFGLGRCRFTQLGERELPDAFISQLCMHALSELFGKGLVSRESETKHLSK